MTLLTRGTRDDAEFYLEGGNLHTATIPPPPDFYPAFQQAHKRYALSFALLHLTFCFLFGRWVRQGTWYATGSSPCFLFCLVAFTSGGARGRRNERVAGYHQTSAYFAAALVEYCLLSRSYFAASGRVTRVDYHVEHNTGSCRYVEGRLYPTSRPVCSRRELLHTCSISRCMSLVFHDMDMTLKFPRAFI